MSNPIRLIASDLDGTLLLPDGTISPRTAHSIQRLREQGILFVMVSARPPRALRMIAHELGLGGLAICCNGAIIYDLDQDKFLSRVAIQPAQTTQLIKKLRSLIPGITFAWEDGLDVTCEVDFSTHHQELITRQQWLAQIAEEGVLHREPIIKLLATHPDYHDIERFYEEVQPIIDKEYAITHSTPYFLEIAATGVDKVKALSNLCAELEIKSEEVIAFGDMPNDIAMLTWSGRGVAVANAHPLVLEAADEITSSNTHDGVAAILETL